MSRGGYPYARGNLLAERNNYFYSEFCGPDFLQAWKRDRDLTLARLPAPSGGVPEPALAGDPFHAGIFDTQRALTYLVQLFPEDPAPFWLERFLQRFEVTKRIHGSYNLAMQPVDSGAWRDLGLYVLFAETMETAHARTGDVRFLNALLKCLDILCALSAELEAALGRRVAHLILREREYVTQLAASRGVPV